MSFNPTVTNAGQAAAFNADNTGFELEITHIAFGTGSYDPTGNETELLNEVKRVAIASGGQISAAQIRMSAVWKSETDDYPITEIGIYADDLLFAVFSRATGGPIGYKTPGVDFVYNYDWLLSAVPPGSVTVLVDSGQSAALSIIGDHLADPDAHPQYLKRSRVIWTGVAGGTPDALQLTIDTADEFIDLEAGQEFTFKAAANNTGGVTVKFGDRDPIAVKKSGTSALDADDIVGGAVYKLIFDGTNAQLTGGVGGGGSSSTIEQVEFTPTEGQTTFPIVYTTGLVEVIVNGRTLFPSEYDESSGTDIVLNEGVSADDAVLIIAYHSFSVANVVTLNSTQSISGVKTFLNSPIVPTAASGDSTTKSANTKFVMDAFGTKIATESAFGTVQYANSTEIALAGSGGGALDRAVSVGRLATLLSSTTARGITRYATNAEAVGSLSNVAMTPAGMNQRIASDAQVSAGIDDIRYVTPLKLTTLLQSRAFLPVAMMMNFAGLSGPVGWLLADGSVQNRATYPDLVAALIKSSTVTMAIGSPGIVTWANHPLQNGYPVKFSNSGGALPTGLVAGTTYYVINKATSTFQVSATAGGAAINFSGSQSGVHTAVCAPFGDGNGTTTFQLPNALGLFMRGWDFGAGVDINRVFGSYQADDNKPHTHTIAALNNPGGTGTVSVQSSVSGSAGTATTASSGTTEARPKNIALTIYIKAWDAPVNQSLIDVAALAASVSNVNNLSQVMHVQDLKPNGTASGAFTSGAYRTRTLNTVVTNTITGASLSSNQITLPAGRYKIAGGACRHQVSSSRARIRDVTNNVTLARSLSHNSDNDTKIDFFKGVFILAGTTVLELQHICKVTQNVDGFGSMLDGIVDDDIYAEVFITKLPS